MHAMYECMQCMYAHVSHALASVQCDALRSHAEQLISQLETQAKHEMQQLEQIITRQQNTTQPSSSVVTVSE